MVIVKVWGGLGNQLFQYAFGKYLAAKLNTQVKYDVQVKPGIKNFTPRDFSLTVFNTIADIANPAEVRQLKYTGNNGIQRLQRKLAQKIPFLFKSYYVEPAVPQSENTLQAKDNCYYDGYWQSYKFLTINDSVLRKELTPKQALRDEVKKTMQQIEKSAAAGIHVRRGDYLQLSHMNICQLPYYKSAVENIESSFPGIKFYIFTDDADWCRQHFTGQQYTLVTGNQPFEDLLLLAACNHVIIANSSFSWWAAWLNSNADKKIIAPSHWHNREEDTYQDIVPAEWVKIDGR